MKTCGGIMLSFALSVAAANGGGADMQTDPKTWRTLTPAGQVCMEVLPGTSRYYLGCAGTADLLGGRDRFWDLPGLQGGEPRPD